MQSVRLPQTVGAFDQRLVMADISVCQYQESEADEGQEDSESVGGGDAGQLLDLAGIKQKDQDHGHHGDQDVDRYQFDLQRPFFIKEGNDKGEDGGSCGEDQQRQGENERGCNPGIGIHALEAGYHEPVVAVHLVIVIGVREPEKQDARCRCQEEE